MKILALDQATKTGWAYNNENGIQCGLWNLSVHKTSGQRLRMLLRRLDMINKMMGVDCVACESFGRMFGHAQLVLPALRGVIELWCHDNEKPIHFFAPTEIKKHALRRGRADKELMFMSAKKKWPHIEIEDHNVADALWILDYARTKFDAATNPE